MRDTPPSYEIVEAPKKRERHVTPAHIAAVCGAIVGVAGVLGMVFVPRSEWTKHTQSQAELQVKMEGAIDRLNTTIEATKRELQTNTNAVEKLSDEMIRVRVKVGTITRGRE